MDFSALLRHENPRMKPDNDLISASLELKDSVLIKGMLIKMRLDLRKHWLIHRTRFDKYNGPIDSDHHSENKRANMA